MIKTLNNFLLFNTSTLKGLNKVSNELNKNASFQPNIIENPFPTKLQHLNNINQKLLQIKEDFKAVYDDYKDQNYMLRKNDIVKKALSYKMDQKIPDIVYTNQEKQLWINLYKKLRYHHKEVMSKQYLQNMDKLEKQFNASENVPQLNQASQYLKSKTGFRLKPVKGMINQRQFLNALAFRTFCCSQYLRHPNSTQYSPEPDLVHEFVGHVPMFADEYIASLSQKIGIMSLGATDEDIKKLGTLYLQIVQFGAVQQKDSNNKKIPKAFGAGIAGSVGQMKNFLSPQADFKKLDIQKDAIAYIPIQEIQYTYRVSESFQQAFKSLLSFQSYIKKDFITTLNKHTKQIEIYWK